MVLPFHSFEIASPLSQARAVEAMQSHVEPINWFRIRITLGFSVVAGDPGSTRFEGEMTGNGFNVRRIMGYNNPCPPQSKGVIAAEGAGSRIKVQMTPHPLVFVVPALLLAAVMSGVATTPDIGAFFAMLAALVAVLLGGFWFEALRQEQTMRVIFQAQ